ncbi:MAG: hypothetical protein WCO00_08215 [Rhodospirillaceae bacterium]
MAPRKITEAQIKGTKVKKNLDISRSFFNTVFDSIYKGFGERVVLSGREVAAVKAGIEASWPQFETMFGNTCVQCMEAPWFAQDERRKDFITRLVCSRIFMRVPDRATASGTKFPRVIAPGLQTMISILLTNREWRILNDHARFIFEYIGGDDDATLAAHFETNETMKQLCERIFITLFLRFKSFTTRRQEFIKIISNAVSETSYRMSEEEFCDVFDAMFGEYYEVIQSETGRLQIAMSHSEDFPERMKAIFEVYLRFRSGLSMAKKYIDTVKKP